MPNEQPRGEEGDALRRLVEGAAARQELRHGEAQPLRLRRLDPRIGRPSYLAEAFFAGPVRPPERPWIQSLVAAGLSLTLAGSLVALPLIGRSRSTGPTATASDALLPAEIAGPLIELPAPPSTPSVGESRNAPAQGLGTAPTATSAPTGGAASIPPAPVGGSDEGGDDAVLPPPVPPVPPVPPDDTPPPSVIPALEGLIGLGGGPASEEPDDTDDDDDTEPPTEGDGQPSPLPPEDEPPDQPDDGDDTDQGEDGDEDEDADQDEGLPPAKVEDEDDGLPPLTGQDEED